MGDENKGTGATWSILHPAGSVKLPTTYAHRIKIVDGKIAAYHTVFDSYNLLPHDGTVSLAARFTFATGMVIGAIAVAVVVGAFVASHQVWQKKKKQNVLLEDQLI